MHWMQPPRQPKKENKENEVHGSRIMTLLQIKPKKPN